VARGGWVRVKGRKKNQGPRGAERRGKKPTHLPTFFLRFSGLILENIFMVFLGSSCRETAKNAIKKNRWEKTKGKKLFFLNFFGQKFLT
jgi:hypothetical protein